MEMSLLYIWEVNIAKIRETESDKKKKAPALTEFTKITKDKMMNV